MPDRPPNRDSRADAGAATKVSPTWLRPFANRRKWRDSWESVVYCSELCRLLKTYRPAGP